MNYHVYARSSRQYENSVVLERERGRELLQEMHALLSYMLYDMAPPLAVLVPPVDHYK